MLPSFHPKLENVQPIRRRALSIDIRAVRCSPAPLFVRRCTDSVPTREVTCLPEGDGDGAVVVGRVVDSLAAAVIILCPYLMREVEPETLLYR